MARRFVAARWKTVTNARRIDLLTVHTAENLEQHDSAEKLANYFAHVQDRQVSAHATSDDESTIDCVLDKDVAWAAPGANHNGWHLELAGAAAQSAADWRDPFTERMLEHQASAVFAEKVKLHRLPLQVVTAADLLAGGPQARGITTHVAISEAFHKSDHHDPGRFFPMSDFVDMIRHHLGGAHPMPPVDNGPWIWVEQGSVEERWWRDFLSVSRMRETHRVRAVPALAKDHPPADFGDPRGLSYVAIPNWPTRLSDKGRAGTLHNMLADAGLS